MSLCAAASHAAVGAQARSSQTAVDSRGALPCDVANGAIVAVGLVITASEWLSHTQPPGELGVFSGITPMILGSAALARACSLRRDALTQG